MNPMIAMGVRSPQFVEPEPQSNTMMRVLQIKGAMDEQQLRGMQRDKLRKDMDDEKALSEVYAGALGPDGALDRNKLLTGLAGRGLGTKIPNVQKSFADADKATADVTKTKAEAAKMELEAGIKKTEHISSMLTQAKDPASYMQVRGIVKQQYGQDLPEQFDPALVQTLIAQGQTITQRLQAEHQRMTLEETKRHNVTTETETGRHNRSTEGISAGQLRVAQGNLGLRQQELEHNRSLPRGQIVESEGGFMLADPRAGTARPVTGPDGQPLKGKAANRQLTEGQGKSTAFAMRAIEAENQLESLGAYNPSVVDRAAMAVPFDATRGLASDKAQKYDTSKRNFIASILRKETGAAVTKPEFEMYDKMYFPQVGDSAQQLADKKRQRDLALEGLMAEAGPGRDVVNANVQRKSAQSPQSAVSSDVDALLKKYGGK